MEFLEPLAASPALFIGCCIVLGLLIGSFLNVVIYRRARDDGQRVALRMRGAGQSRRARRRRRSIS